MSTKNAFETFLVYNNYSTKNNEDKNMLDKKDELKKEELEEVNGGVGPKIQLIKATAGLSVAVLVGGLFAQKQNEQK